MPAISVGLVNRDNDAVLDEKVRHRRDIGQIGDILESQRIRSQQAHGHQRQRRILGTTNRNNPLERHATFDADLIHCPRSTLYLRATPAPDRSLAFPEAWGAAQAGGSRSRSDPSDRATARLSCARLCSLRRSRLIRNSLASRSSRAARLLFFLGVKWGGSLIPGCNESTAQTVKESSTPRSEFSHSYALAWAG